MKPKILYIVATLFLGTGVLSAATTYAQSNGTMPVSQLETIQVTATRFGESIQEVPGSISIVTGESIRARGATDLRTALALLGGVSVAPGGDAGPAGAVPGLLGLREVDDLLLLIDGIPAGGVFVPPFEAVNLVNVERIEVLRGTAPVYFGTTAFAGTVNVIHYPAGRADAGISLTYGSYGSLGVSGAGVISAEGVKQSFSGELSKDQQSDARAGFKRAQGSYRLGGDVAGGQARADFNVLLLRQKPGSPSPIDDSGQLHSDLSPDFNQNPADAKLDTNRYQLVLGYDTTVPLGRWGITLALTETKVNSVRGFLVADYPDAIGDNASGFTQSRHLHELFFDTHITQRLLPGFDVTFGLNELMGRAQQDSTAYSYSVPLNGATPSPLSAGTIGDEISLSDRRSFFGAYVQSRLLLSKDASVLVGLRWNQTRETRHALADDGNAVSESHGNARFSGSLGGEWRLWQDQQFVLDDLVVHASVGNTFQPPQIDFGPEAGFDPLLRPETQRSLIVGAKADALDGRFDVDLSAFFVDFDNQPISSQLNGTPVLTAGGKQRFKGIELETTWRPLRAWRLAAHASLSDARYRDFDSQVDGVQTQLSGNQLVMSSRLRAGAGIIYAPHRGWRGSLTTTYTGPRYLDQLNTARVGGYNVFDASLGYRFDRMRLTLSAANLTNRRDAILPSELGENQFYRMTARRFDIVLNVPF
jgi:outer membrane receptor protein involved in Fe transport